MTVFFFPRILACAMLMFLLAPAPAHALLDAIRPMKKPSPSVLSMVWTLPSHVKPNFQPTWYQDCGNPTVRRVVYEDDLYDDDNHNYSYEFTFHNYGSDWSSHQDTTQSSESQPETLPRGARISRAARRAINGIRNTLRP